MLVLVAVLFSTIYIAAETDHDCSGEDCPVCACMQMCESTLRLISGVAGAAGSLAVPVVFAGIFSLYTSLIFRQETPVSRKVRLNN